MVDTLQGIKWQEVDILETLIHTYPTIKEDCWYQSKHRRQKYVGGEGAKYWLDVWELNLAMPTLLFTDTLSSSVDDG